MPKTKFSKIAFQKRCCELCGKVLEKEEVYICKVCFESILEINGGANYD